MEAFIFLVFAVVIIGSIIYQYYFDKDKVVKRKLKRSRLKHIGSFRNGPIAKIIGHIVLVDEPLKAPLSNRPCALYYVNVEELRGGKNSKWVSIIEERVYGRFLITDGEYYAYINTTEIESYIVQDKEYSSETFNDASPQLEAYLQQHGEKSTGFFGFNKSIRYCEGILEENERVAVYGKGTWKEASELGLPTKYGNILEITAPENEAVFLSDSPDTTIGEARKEFEHLKLYKYRIENP